MADLATGNLGLFMKTSGLHWWGPELTAVEGHVNFDKEQLYSWPAPRLGDWLSRYASRPEVHTFGCQFICTRGR